MDRLKYTVYFTSLSWTRKSFLSKYIIVREVVILLFDNTAVLVSETQTTRVVCKESPVCLSAATAPRCSGAERVRHVFRHDVTKHEVL